MPLAQKKKPRSLISHTVSDNQIATADEWMTIEQAADWLQTKPTHIRDLIHQNAIPSSKLGNKRRLHRPTIRDWLLTQ